MNRAIAYLRESTARQELGLDAQRDRIAAWCQMHDYELVATHTDAGISGRRADNRPGLQAALAATVEAKGSAIVVYSLSRLARSVIDAMRIAERLDKAECDLVSLSESIDTTTATGKMVFRLLAVLAQFEADIIAERTSAALQTKKKRGQCVGSVPYGYALAPDGIQLVADEMEQQVLSDIAQLRAKGLGMRAIARTLTDRNIPTKTDKTIWNQATIRRILKRAI